MGELSPGDLFTTVNPLNSPDARRWIWKKIDIESTDRNVELVFNRAGDPAMKVGSRSYLTDGVTVYHLDLEYWLTR